MEIAGVTRFSTLCKLFEAVDDASTEERKCGLLASYFCVLAETSGMSTTGHCFAALRLCLGHRGSLKKRKFWMTEWSQCLQSDPVTPSVRLEVGDVQSQLVAIENDVAQRSELMKKLHAATTPFEHTYLTLFFEGALLPGVREETVMKALAMAYCDFRSVPEEEMPKLRNFLPIAYKKHRSLEDVMERLLQNENTENLDQLIANLSSWCVKIGSPLNLSHYSKSRADLRETTRWCRCVFNDEQKFQMHYDRSSDKKFTFYDSDLIEEPTEKADFTEFEERVSKLVKNCILELHINEDKSIELWDLLFVNDLPLLKRTYSERTNFIKDFFTETTSLRVAPFCLLDDLEMIDDAFESLENQSGTVELRALDAPIEMLNTDEEIIWKVRLDSARRMKDDFPREVHRIGLSALVANHSIVIYEHPKGNYGVQLKNNDFTGSSTYKGNVYDLKAQIKTENYAKALKEILNKQSSCKGVSFASDFSHGLLDNLAYNDVHIDQICGYIMRLNEYETRLLWQKKTAQVGDSMLKLHANLTERYHWLERSTSTISNAKKLALHYLFSNVYFAVTNCAFDIDDVIPDMRAILAQLRGEEERFESISCISDYHVAMALHVGVSNVCKDWHSARLNRTFESMQRRFKKAREEVSEAMNLVRKDQSSIRSVSLKLLKIFDEQYGSDESERNLAIYNAICRFPTFLFGELHGAEEPYEFQGSFHHEIACIRLVERQPAFVLPEKKVEPRVSTSTDDELSQVEFDVEFEEIIKEFEDLLKGDAGIFEKRPQVVRDYVMSSFLYL